MRNFGVLIKNGPVANRKAEKHLNEALSIAHAIGAKETAGRAHLALGLLHKSKGRHEKARECLLAAVHIFEECEAQLYVKMAEEALGD